MTQFNYKAGLRNVGSYQSSGNPYVSGGINASVADGQAVDFPSVTRWIVVTNNDSNIPCRIGFSQNGILGSNYLTVPVSSMSPRLEVKVTQLFLSGSDDVDVMCGLTSIAIEAIDNASVSPLGQNWSGSAGTLVG